MKPHWNVADDGTETECSGEALVDAAAAEPRLAVDPVGLAEHEPAGADAVAAEIEERAAAERWHEPHVVLAWQTPEELGADGLHLSDAGQQLADQPGLIRVTPHVRLRQDERRGCSARVPRLVDLRRHARVRLLDEHVLAGVERAQRPLVVQRVRQRDVDGVDLLVGEQRIVRTASARGDPVLAGVRLGARLVARRDRDDLERRIIASRSQDRPVDRGGREEPDADSRHGRTYSRGVSNDALRRRARAALAAGAERAPARAHFRAMGIDPVRLDGPIVGVASTWTGTMPCNLNQRELAERVADGVAAAGGVALAFNTIAVSDNQSQGTPGMRASLISREVIADSIELMVHAHDFDALVCLVGCDKTVPAALMALARVDKPAVVLYSGPMRAGRLRGREVTIQDVWEGLGAEERGLITRAELDELERVACPGAGTCAGHFTANTMAVALDCLGIATIGDGLIPADELEAKGSAAERAGALGRTTCRRRADRTQLPRSPRAAERHGRDRCDRRLDERDPPPARDRARGRRRADPRRARRGRRAARR